MIKESFSQLVKYTLENPEVKQIMDNSKFDLVILGYYFNEALLG